MMEKVKRSIFSENLNHFSPDDFSEEEKMIKSTVKQFVENKVYPQLPEMEAHNYDVIRSLFKESGELGLLGADVSEEYRSEEHTSELQSRGHLVCRLLLE